MEALARRIRLDIAQMTWQSGLKGATIGGAQVSEKHCGFIVNIGGATATDVIRLIDHVKETVAQKQGVIMETEVRIIGGAE